MAGVQEYIAQFPVMPTQLFGPMFWYAGSSLPFFFSISTATFLFSFLYVTTIHLQMYKCGTHDDSRAKVSSEQVHHGGDP